MEKLIKQLGELVDEAIESKFKAAFEVLKSTYEDTEELGDVEFGRLVAEEDLAVYVYPSVYTYADKLKHALKQRIDLAVGDAVERKEALARHLHSESVEEENILNESFNEFSSDPK